MASGVRRILGITGIRSEYFFQRPLFRAIERHPGLELELVVTGAHLSPLHDWTARIVEADDFTIAARIDSLVHEDRPAARLEGAAHQLAELTEVVERLRPDWLLAPGDREEALTIALCGAYLNVATAHYAAGDRVVGNVDDMVRHAISRLAHLLMTTSEDARTRLIAAGEEPWRVHAVGHSGIDRFQEAAVVDDAELARRLGVARIEHPYVVVLQHPISSAVDASGPYFEETLEAVAALSLQTFVIHPNSDPGSEAMLTVLDRYRDREGIVMRANVEDVAFANLLRGAALLVGNSSLGVLEAPFLKLAAINVGQRQTGREHAENLFFVPPERGAIKAQARALLTDAALQERVRNCSNPFGDGRAGERVARLLAETELDERLLNKDLTF